MTYQVRRVIKQMRVVLALLVLPACQNAQATEVVDFHLPDIKGNTVRLSDYRGQWVIVNFWATWCGPCLQEIPELNRYHQRHSNRVVLGINYEQIAIEDLMKFIEEFGVVYPVLLIGDTPLVPFEPLKGLPSTFIVSPDGEYIASHIGQASETWLNDTIAAHADE